MPRISILYGRCKQVCVLPPLNAFFTGTLLRSIQMQICARTEAPEADDVQRALEEIAKTQEFSSRKSHRNPCVLQFDLVLARVGGLARRFSVRFNIYPPDIAAKVLQRIL